MNCKRFSVLSAVASALTVLVASAASAAARCDAPVQRVDRIACAKAQESPAALRRFIDRTRSIYALYFWDYMSEADLDRHHAAQARPAASRPLADRALRAPDVVGPGNR